MNQNSAFNPVKNSACEQLSALMDGELTDAELAQLMRDMPESAHSTLVYSSWQSYHVVGSALRGVVEADAGSVDFLARLNAQLAQEPSLVAHEQPAAGAIGVPDLQPAVAPVAARQLDAANHSVFRWKMVAGFASVVAVAMVGWNSLDALQRGTAQSGQQLAHSQTVTTPIATAQTLVQTPVIVGQNATVMLRDPRLDELLAARGQMGGTTNLQMPASFLRNATFGAERRSGGCADKTARLC